VAARTVAIDTPYELKIAVRGDLINVAIDDVHTLAYRLKQKRETGRMDLVAFDAIVEFDSLEVRRLSPARRLSEPGQTAAPDPEQLALKLAFDEATLAAAELKPAMHRAAFAADQAKLNSPNDDRTKELITEAATAARRHELAMAQAAVAKSLLSLGSKLDEAKTKVVQDRLKKEQAALVKAQAAVEKPGTRYSPIYASLKGLEGPAETEVSRRARYPKTSSGRRTAFAQWIVAPANPLPSRVAVNHIWLRHFGQPLVDPVEDFGRRTKAPPMQDLLDWLAVDFQENGWSMKHLHRLIVTSQAYQRSTGIGNADEATVQADPTNQFYWRRLPVRMESQLVRDSVLHLAGVLDLKMGGPTLNPKDAKVRRRSLYFTQSRDARNAFVMMFDDADIQRCYRRSESIVPQQALAMANSRLTLEMSRLLAERIAADTPALPDDDAAFIGATFEVLLGRQPTDSETTECRSTLAQLLEVLKGRADAKSRAHTALVHALLNHNDFVTIR
jgi:hypothetical protein